MTGDRFLAQNPGLAADLALNHPVLADMNARLRRFGSLSDPTVAYARKLANDVRNPERHVPAPEGRVTVTGTVVSVKWHESNYGGSYKMTVKVATDDGSWLAWGSVPSKLSGNPEKNLKGAVVEFTASLTRGKDDYFALYKRPTAAKVVTPAPESPADRAARVAVAAVDTDASPDELEQAAAVADDANRKDLAEPLRALAAAKRPSLMDLAKALDKTDRKAA